MRKIHNSTAFRKSKTFMMKKTVLLVVAFLLLATGSVTALTLLPQKDASSNSQVEGVVTSSFLETFNGNPSFPTVFNPSHWDVITNVSDSWASGANWDKFDSTHAHHGSDCAAPFALHTVNNIYSAVFTCRDHMMTTVENRGYGVVYLTPNQKVNFDNEEAVISFDVSTFKSSGRQWWDLWIQPFQNNFQLPLESWLPAYNGKPKQAVSIKMEGETFNGFYVNNFQQIDIPKTGDGWKSVAQVLSENGLEPSATRRDKFELRISKNHIKFGMPQYNHWWIDTDIPDRGWSEGTVTIGHHEYNSSKDCTPNPPYDCAATTFHWDNFAINPAVPFTLIKGNERGVNSTTDNKVTFPSPAPANAFLKFSAVGTIQVSYDNGATYKTVAKLPQEKDQAEHFSNYFTPIPAGTTSVLFKGSPDGYISQWLVRDPSIYAEGVSGGNTGGTNSTPTSAPTALPTKTPAPTAVPNIPTATPTRVPTPIPAGSSIIDFNSGSAGPIVGAYPTGVINWGSNKWYLSEPWSLLPTKSISFNGGTLKSATFDFVTPQILKKLDAYADTDSTVTISCSGLPSKKVNLSAKTLSTISTDWVSACTRVTIASTNGWDTNFDNFVLSAGVLPTPTKTGPTPTPTIKPTITPLITSSVATWRGEYFNSSTLSGDPTFVRNDKKIAFNWRGGSPNKAISKDNFSARWTKTEPFEGGTYQFTVSNDDGMRIALDGEVIYSSWKNQPASTQKFNVGIPAGIHTVTVTYYENWGNASARVSWKRI